MDVSWLLLVMAAAVFVSSVLLVVGCLRCRHKGPLVSIRQVNASDEYIPRIYPYQPNSDRIHIHPPSNPLTHFSRSADPGTQRSHRSSESNPSYENPADGGGYINTESDPEDPGYITVLPDSKSNQSRASTPSSDVQHDYENVPKKEDYLNVELLHFPRSASDLSTQSDDDDDDDEGNYVNVQDGTQTERPQ